MTMMFVGKVTSTDDKEKELVPASDVSSTDTVPFQTANNPFYTFRVVYDTTNTIIRYDISTI